MGNEGSPSLCRSAYQSVCEPKSLPPIMPFRTFFGCALGSLRYERFGYADALADLQRGRSCLTAWKLGASAIRGGAQGPTRDKKAQYDGH